MFFASVIEDRALERKGRKGNAIEICFAFGFLRAWFAPSGALARLRSYFCFAFLFEFVFANGLVENGKV
jgi:hypothetical protein